MSVHGQLQKKLLLRLGFSLLAVGMAASLRVWPLHALELRIPWVTFYPAVMITALYGGFRTGLFAALFSAAAVVFWSPTQAPFIDDPGDWLGVFVFLMNCILISAMSEAMHRARTRATKALEQAEAANRAKTVFLANMSHELRTPLNAILGFSRLLTQTKLTAAQGTKVDIITTSGEHLLGLINNVLDISKIEAGHLFKEENSIPISSFLKDITSLMSVQVAKKGLSLVIDTSPDLPEVISVDAGKLRQVLINLIANATKYTERGRIELRIKRRPHDRPERILLNFEVEDTGIGIPEEAIASTFMPFEQLVGTASVESGTGLGLTICKQYVELLGGSIMVRSEVGVGSVYSFEIPVTLAESSAATGTDRNRRVSTLAPGQGPFRVLVAEDQPENRMLLRELLEGIGFEIEEAENGQIAVDLAEEWRPHLIFNRFS